MIIKARQRAHALLLWSFFLSGCCALAYQVTWQRAMFAHIGVDIDSITIIVSAFMLGIGIGGMTGGWLADTFPAHRLRIYALIELTIGLFGLCSLALLPGLVELLPSGGAGSAVACFAFLMLPTVLMGITLPLLTMAFDEGQGNIGISVGILYFANTLGAALGAALVPLVLFPYWGLSQVARFAAAGNVLVMACALLAAWNLKRARALS